MSPLLALLVVAPLVDWIVAGLLIRAAIRYTGVAALRERAILAMVIAAATTVYCVAAFNAVNGFPLLDLGAGQTVARVAVASIGLVPVYWLYLYWRGFGGHDE